MMCLMKEYYSAVKEYETRKRPHPFYKGARAFVKLFFPRTSFRFTADEPREGDAVVYVCNHTRLYAPAYFVMKHGEKTRVWENNYFLFGKECRRHIREKVFPEKRGLRTLGVLLSPFVVAVSRAIEPVPVYHKCEKVYSATFEKSVQTLQEGIPLVIFPERTVNKVNRYLYQLNHGFPELGKIYYERTGKRVSFFPTYCAPELHTVVVGRPISYDPKEDMETQRTKICSYLETAIARLGDSLPSHKPTLYV